MREKIAIDSIRVMHGDPDHFIAFQVKIHHEDEQSAGSYKKEIPMGLGYPLYEFSFLLKEKPSLINRLYMRLYGYRWFDK